MSTGHNEQYDSLGSCAYEVNHKKPILLRTPALKTLLCIAITAISFIGITHICSLFPDSITPLMRFISFIGVLIMVIRAFSIYERQLSHISHARAHQKEAERNLENAWKDLHKAVLFLLYMDEHLWDKVHTGDTALTDYPYDTPCTKDIALGLILEHLRELNTSKEIARDELSRSFSALDEQGKFYDLLQQLDDLMLKHIPETIKTLHEKEVFSLRFNLLKFVLEALEKNEYFSFDYNEDNAYYYIESLSGSSRRRTKYRWEDAPIIDFFIMVLNEFYASDVCYEEQYHEFDTQIFMQYFGAGAVTGTLMKNDLQESIANHEKAIAELEEDIPDLRVQIHDLQILLDVFFAEYNAKLGFLYVELDRIKLKIKEYKKRIELAEGRTITDEEAEKIEEEIDNLFSDARKKVNDLEDETAEASEEYERYMEEEEQKELIGQDFLNQLKQLFRQLVHKFHPDMAESKEQKKEFHDIFIKIKEAYDRRDIDLLREFKGKLDLEEKKENESPEEKLERLKNEYEKLQTIHKNLIAKLDSLNSSELNKLRVRVEEERSEGRDLLQELADAVEREIELRQEELNELKQEYNEIIMQSV
jgi:hypothetical protein